MAEVVPMRWDWPAEVNYHEAKAFCAWKAEQTGETVRLPTEDEWYRLVDVADIEELDENSAPANIHLDHFASSCPVNHFAQAIFMMSEAMYGNGQKRQFIRSMGHRFIAFMTTSLRRHMMENII